MSKTRVEWLLALSALAGCAAAGVDVPDGAPPLANETPSHPDSGEAEADAGAVDASADASAEPSLDAAAKDAPDASIDASVDAQLDASAADATAPQDAGTLVDAQLDAGDATLEAFCQGEGPVIRIPTSSTTADSSTNACTGVVARQLFTNALCTCEDATFAGYLDTGSYSSLEPSQVAKAGGPVGINGSLVSGSYLDVGGSLRVQGPATVAGYINVWGDLELHQHTEFYGYLTVARDAWFGGGISYIPGWYGEIGRDAHTYTGRNAPPFWTNVGGTNTQSTFQLDTPCACADEDLLPVDEIVKDAKLHNDNAHPDVNLDAGDLTNLVGARSVTLPCGRYYLDEISGVGDVRLVVNGRTALFIGGDVSAVGRFDIDLGPDGELDVFIAGDLTQVGYGSFGDLDRPAGVRVYVGGEGDITYLGYQPFGGNLYAPRSHLLSEGFVDVRGSLFVRSLGAGAYAKVLYDREVLEQGNEDECQPDPEPAPEPDAGPPPPECDGACDSACGSRQTCVDGMCQGCVTDADCCGPLVCKDDGTCGPLLL